PVSPAITRHLQEFAVAAFRAIDCSGMARVDFFVERGTDRVLVNEINTIPGFTATSAYAKMWAASGLAYADLVDRLIALALERHQRRGGAGGGLARRRRHRGRRHGRTHEPGPRGGGPAARARDRLRVDRLARRHRSPARSADRPSLRRDLHGQAPPL